MALNSTALTVFILLFGFITWLGFASARWRKGDLDQLHEWGLGGRRFGTLITWFLLGGDMYTAYTFIAVPALAFGAGAAAFFAVPYTVMVYPILFIVFPRLWYVSNKRGYITAGDFVRGRFGNRWLALGITVTGIMATMPYIALQLVGLQVVIGAMGVTGGLQAVMNAWGITGMEGLTADLPLLIAFVILAAFTYSSGLRAPAAIAIVKDVLIYVTAFAALIIVPYKLGGFGNIFHAVPDTKLLLAPPQGATTGSYGTYATLAFGSALALLLYPHSMTAILSASSGQTVRRNAALLPAYSFLLGLLALLGLFAIADGVDKLPEFKAGFDQFRNNFAVPALILHNFDPWFAGVAFAAIGIGALVPAAIMSIAAANLFTRNIYREFLDPEVSGRMESQVAKWMSLIVKFGALAFIFFVPLQYAIQLQLLGGIWMTQILPALIIGLYTRWLNPWALLIGWGAGTFVGTALAAAGNFAASYTLVIAGWSFPSYIAVYALAINLVLSVVLTPLFNAFAAKHSDETQPGDYHPAAARW